MAHAVAVESLSAPAAQDTSSNATQCVPSCVNQYRSLSGIVLSCLTTVFLCVWVSLHLNIPEPMNTRDLGHLNRIKIQTKIFVRCRVVPILVTLMVPEWALGMAALQFCKANQLANKLATTRQQAFFILMGGFHLFKRSKEASLYGIREKNREGSQPLAGESALEASLPSNKTINAVEEDFGEPLHPLDEFDICHLIKSGKLCFPTPAELQDKCKSDGLAKFLVLVQVLWFITQCIGRKVSGLPLTELEVITLGYTLLTVAMYIAWWDKPYQVTFPVRVYETLPERTDGQDDGDANLRNTKGIPMFHSGYKDHRAESVGRTIMFTVGTLFGTIHFLAWFSPFPSSRMQFLWRFATIVVTVVPPAMIVVAGLTLLVHRLFGVLLVYIPILYLVGRGITIVMAFKGLAHLPPDAYRDVEWSDFFPHI